MALTLAAAAYQNFLETVGSATSRGQTIAIKKFALAFQRWDDQIRADCSDLAEAPDGFDRAFLFAAAPRNKKMRRNPNKKYRVILIGLDSRRQRLLALTQHVTPDVHRTLESPEAQAKALAGTGAYHLDAFGSVRTMRDTIWEEVAQTRHQVGIRLDAVLRLSGLKLTGGEARALRATGNAAAQAAIDAKFQPVVAALDQALDQEVLRASIAAVKPNSTLNEIKIYNHICMAEGQARRFRLGAVAALSPIGEYRTGDAVFWASIDAGGRLHEALGRSVQVSAATVRNVYRRANTFYGLTGQLFEATLQNLEPLDVALWPEGKAELYAFHAFCSVRDKYAEAFSRTPAQATRELASRLPRTGARRWEGLVETILAPFYDKSPRNGGKRKQASTRDQAVTDYAANLRSIGDLKRDVEQRLVVPAVLLAFETQGWQVATRSAVAPLCAQLMQAVWQVSPPSEQIAASAYWHSPQINFSNRFTSLAVAGSGISWRSLATGPLRAANGTILVPLDSDAALREEGQTMRHCVWSYTQSCLSRGYHIFSVRDAEGQRLSTLTVIDKLESGKRLVSLNQNKSVQNAPPPAAAKVAEGWLIAGVNDGTIPVDWTAVDASKAEHLVKELDRTIGYDFRDAGMRQKIFDLYEPVLPRKLLQRWGRQAEKFYAGLGVAALVEQTVTDPSFNRQGGFVRLEAARPGMGAPERPAALER